MLYEEYVNSCNVEVQRKRLWVKNQELKNAFAKKLEELITEANITSDSEYTDLHKILHGNNDSSYDQLYKLEDGKEFMFSEFQSRLALLKQSEKDNAIVAFTQLMKQKLRGTILNEHTKWDDVKSKLKEDSRYQLVKSSKLRERLFDDFIMSEILITPG